MQAAKALARLDECAGASEPALLAYTINTHYHNSNLIWRTVSRRDDEVIPSDHPRRVDFKTCFGL